MILSQVDDLQGFASHLWTRREIAQPKHGQTISYQWQKRHRTVFSTDNDPPTGSHGGNNEGVDDKDDDELCQFQGFKCIPNISEGCIAKGEVKEDEKNG